MKHDHATVLRALRSDARNWWSYANNPEMQAKAVRENVRALREAKDAGGYLSIGRGDTVIHSQQRDPETGRVRSTSRRSCHPGMAAAARRILPWIDSTTVPDDKIVHVAIRLPMIEPDWRATEPDRFVPRKAAQYGSLDSIPLPEYVALAAPFGLTHGNFPPELAARIPVRSASRNG